MALVNRFVDEPYHRTSFTLASNFASEVSRAPRCAAPAGKPSAPVKHRSIHGAPKPDRTCGRPPCQGRHRLHGPPPPRGDAPPLVSSAPSLAGLLPTRPRPSPPLYLPYLPLLSSSPPQPLTEPATCQATHPRLGVVDHISCHPLDDRGDLQDAAALVTPPAPPPALSGVRKAPQPPADAFPPRVGRPWSLICQLGLRLEASARRWLPGPTPPLSTSTGRQTSREGAWTTFAAASVPSPPLPSSSPVPAPSLPLLPSVPRSCAFPSSHRPSSPVKLNASDRLRAAGYFKGSAGGSWVGAIDGGCTLPPDCGPVRAETPDTTCVDPPPAVRLCLLVSLPSVAARSTRGGDAPRRRTF